MSIPKTAANAKVLVVAIDGKRVRRIGLNLQAIRTGVARGIQTLRQLLPDDKEGVAPSLPAIVGEAFLFDHLGHGEAQASTEAVLRCVRAGLGLGVVSRLASTEGVRRNEFVELVLPDFRPRRGFWLITRTGRTLSPAERAFIHLLTEGK